MAGPIGIPEGQCDPATSPRTELSGLSPDQVRFTQQEINSTFKEGRKIFQTLQDLYQQTLQKRAIQPIRVVCFRAKDGACRYFSVDNPRLAVFRMLQMLAPRVRIRATVISQAEGGFNGKHNTESDGRTVRVQ